MTKSAEGVASPSQWHSVASSTFLSSEDTGETPVL